MNSTLNTLFTTLTFLGGVVIAMPLLSQDTRPSTAPRQTDGTMGDHRGMMNMMTDNPDVAYCSTLTKKYNQYLNETIGQGAPATSLDGRVAIEQCSSGNTKASIFVLEQKLSNAKIDLPKSQMGADRVR